MNQLRDLTRMRESVFGTSISELAEERLVLLSTHIVSDVEFIANKIVLMKEGQCCFEGTSDEVIASMDKKVYCFVAPREQVDHYMRNYLVVNVKHSDRMRNLEFSQIVNRSKGHALRKQHWKMHF